MDFRRWVQVSVLVFSIPAFTACNPGKLIGIGGDNSSSTFEPDYSMPPPAHRADHPCNDPDPSHLCIAVKYVSFESGSGTTTTQAVANSNLVAVSDTWKQCQIQFVLETYRSVNAANEGVPQAPSSMDQLDTIRAHFASDGQLLVATTAQWTGALGSQPASGWTVLPPTGPFGTLIEESVAAYPQIVAHELGHYLNLDHAQDAYNVMNPVVYQNSLNLTADQCKMARATAISFWGAALR